MASTARLVAALGGGDDCTWQTLATDADLDAVALTPVRQLVPDVHDAIATAVSSGNSASLRLRTAIVFRCLSYSERKHLFLAVCRSLLNDSPRHLPTVEATVVWLRAHALFEFLGGLLDGKVAFEGGRQRKRPPSNEDAEEQSERTSIHVLWEVVAKEDKGSCRVRSSRGNATHATWYDVLLRLALERTSLMGSHDVARRVLEEHRMLAQEARTQIAMMETLGLVAPFQLPALWGMVGGDMRRLLPQREDQGNLEAVAALVNDPMVSDLLKCFDFESGLNDGFGDDDDHDVNQRRITDHYPAKRINKLKTDKTMQEMPEPASNFRLRVVAAAEPPDSAVALQIAKKKRRSGKRARQSLSTRRWQLRERTWGSLEVGLGDLRCEERIEHICVDWV